MKQKIIFFFMLVNVALSYSMDWGYLYRKISPGISKEIDKEKRAEEATKELLQIINNPSKFEEIPLNVFEKLIENNANLNVQCNILKYTALIFAAAANRLDIVELLLKAGADPNIKAGSRPLPGYTALFSAVCRNNYEIAERLLEAGADPNSPITNIKVTPLMHAAKHGNKDLVILLLNWGANKALKDRLNKTAVDLARESKHQDIVELLLLKNAKIL